MSPPESAAIRNRMLKRTPMALLAVSIREPPAVWLQGAVGGEIRAVTIDLNKTLQSDTKSAPAGHRNSRAATSNSAANAGEIPDPA